jgi:predicted nuclease of predicted toxin-antitoxin system
MTKILADVNLSPRVVTALRAAGFDAVRVSDLMPACSADEDVLAEAVRLGAVLVSQDQDFAALLATTGATRPSAREPPGLARGSRSDRRYHRRGHADGAG